MCIRDRFLPAEAVFSYIYASCDEVVRYSYEEKVYMVSPTTLMAYLTAIRAIYLGVQRNEHVEQIQQEMCIRDRHTCVYYRIRK